MTYKILQNEKIGRYAVAAKNFKPGETIFEEVPFVVGPKLDTNPVCLGCYAFVDGSVVCSKCKWPVCGPDCEKITKHAEAECKVFSDAKVSWQKPEDISLIDPQYDCITALRMLIAKEANPEKWKSVEVLLSHNDKRKEKPAWEAETVNVVKFLRDRCKLERFTEDLIHHVCGVLEVNAYEAPTSTQNTVRALYPQLAIISHSCVPNTAHSIIAGPASTLEDFQVTVRASVKINENDELFSCYAYVLLPTILRREVLEETKYFGCECRRCLDPTELGTHVGSLKCTKCDNGLVISTDPKNSTAKWKCTHCEFSTTGNAVKKALQTIQAELDACDEAGFSAEAIEMRETIGKKYRSIFHPRHYIQTCIRQSLSQLYGRVEGYALDDLPDLLLERKVELCQEILKVLDVVEPGYTRLRGLTLYELHAPLIFLAKNEYQAGLINEEKLRKKLNDAANILEEAGMILSLDNEASAEGSLGIMAKQMLEQFKGSMDAMIAAL